MGITLGLGSWVGCAPEAIESAVPSPDGLRPPPESPNIVLIFTDDQGHADLGVFGADGFATPTLDQMAADGVRFTDFYVSQAVCSASRASLLTGCYAERVGIFGALFPDSTEGLADDEVTIAEMLQARGYATGAVGKWHLGSIPEALPLQHGFEEYLGLPYSNDMWPNDYGGEPVTEGPRFRPLPLMEGNEVIGYIETLEDQATLTTRYAERAVDYIERHAGDPFFLYLAHSMPHVPLGVSDKFLGHSAQGKYGDVIEEIDWSVGQVLAALDRHGLTENTLVIFTSDNGPWLRFGDHGGSAGPLRGGKGAALEGGPRVPAIMRWPARIPAGQVCTRLASTLDILPTLAEVTGATLPDATIDGVSILSLLEGDVRAVPRDVFYFYFGGQLRGLRQGRYKRVFEHRSPTLTGAPGEDGYPGDPMEHLTVPAALYDLRDDVGETTDISAQFPAVVARLDALAEEARAELGDRLTARMGAGSRFRRPDPVVHRGLGAAVTLRNEPNPAYPGQGAATLTSGRLAGPGRLDPLWLGFRESDLNATLDLGHPLAISRVGLSCLQSAHFGVFFPSSVSVSTSVDGVRWRVAGAAKHAGSPEPEEERRRFEVSVSEREARYVRVIARCSEIPPGSSGEGHPAWLLVDQILVS